MWMALEPPSGSHRGPTELESWKGPGFQERVFVMCVGDQFTQTYQLLQCAQHTILNTRNAKMNKCWSLPSWNSQPTTQTSKNRNNSETM